jgi:putative sigma-54 modulation protein
MNIKIQSIGFDADKKLITFIEKKVGKLFKVSEDIINAEIMLRLQPSKDEANKVAEIKLEVPGNDLFAKKQCKSFEEAVDNVAEALEKQLIKRKGKIRGI